MSNTKNIDSANATYQNVKDYSWTGEVAPLNTASLSEVKGIGAFFGTMFKKRGAIATIVIAALLLAAMLLTWLWESFSIIGIIFGLFLIPFLFIPIGLAMLIAAAIHYLLVQKDKDQNVFRLFAEKNNLSYSPTVQNTNLASSLSDMPYNATISDEFSGDFSGLPFRMFNYTYYVRSNTTLTSRNRRSSNTKAYNIYVMEITLPRQMPHLVVDSLVESQGLLKPSALPVKFDKSLAMQLEGDFYKYFDIYTWDRDAVTNLAILTPDTMATLIDHGIKYDMEIVKDKFYLYTSKTSPLKEVLADIHNTATIIFSKIGRQLTTANILTNRSPENTTNHEKRNETQPLQSKQNPATHKRLLNNYNRVGWASIAISILSIAGFLAISGRLSGDNSLFADNNRFSLLIISFMIISIIYNAWQRNKKSSR